LTKETRRESLKKMFLMVKKKHLKKPFFSQQFFIAVFVGGIQFSPIFELYSNRLFIPRNCCKKPEGVLGRL
jgi:hypothetical protein